MTNDQYERLEIVLDYESAFGEKKKQCKSIIKLSENEKLFNQQKLRLEFVDFIRKGHKLLCENSFDDNQQKVADNLQLLEEKIKNHSTDDKYLTDLLIDLTGQVKEAFSRNDWFTKWGKHYLPSLARMSIILKTKFLYCYFLILGAHLYQQCNNFKDPGVQHYGQGDLFNSIRDDMDSIFCSLPASTPSSSNGTHGTTTVDMSQFNNANNPCFHGSCTVKLIDGSIKFVKDIKRGDQLYPHGGSVNYILRTICNNKQTPLVLVCIFRFYDLI